MTAEDTAQSGGGRDTLSRLMGPTDDLAERKPKSRVDRILQWVPRLLSSKPHVVLLMALGVYLIVLPLAGLNVSAVRPTRVTVRPTQVDTDQRRTR